MSGIRVIIAGQKWFGAEVLSALLKSGHADVIAVSAPAGETDGKLDRLALAAQARGIPIIPAGTLTAARIPDGTDLIIAAHSHDFISERARHRATWGGIGYHPSLLPVHRGRDAIRWALRMNDRVTGGTVYRLSNRMDGGRILAQRHVFIRPGDTPAKLWQRDLGPLGVELLTGVVERHALEGYIHGTGQDEALATWEPSIDRPPAHRPDLLMLPLQGQ